MQTRDIFQASGRFFERAGVAISATGDAALLVGPESAVFGKDFGKLDKVFVLKEFRESADPSYPELKADTFRDVFNAIGVKGENLRIGLGSYFECTLPIYEGLCDAFPKAEITKCNDIMVALRKIKSENELACIREGFRIIELATNEVIKNLKPGVTELQMVGIAQRVIYENGAEYEGIPMYVFSEESTRHAISRSRYREIGKNDIVQLNLSAKIDGYSPSIGLPVVMGKLKGERRELVEFCRQMHEWTCEQLRAGVVASDVAKAFLQKYKDAAFENYVYYVFMSMLSAGYRNIYVLIHHQFEQESEMPMTLCYRMAAKRATMAYLEKTLGQSWWGSESYADYYEQLEGADNPFNWIKVIPTMSTAVQNATGYDHAGKYECSILMSLYPDCVQLDRIDDIKHWFTESAREANKALGDEMVEKSLEYLDTVIV